MNDVNPIKPFQFYCQPIIPLVYDESLSYYETLCKVVGQLNTTGETVNKLNEGLTEEISDRQAADAALDARIKEIEETNGKIHFLVFDGSNPSGAMPTRSELFNWVSDGDIICTLFRTNEPGRSQIYAVSCSYNAGNWGGEASPDFNLIVPFETEYDAAQDYAVKQKIAKLTIPPIAHADLNTPWRLQIIEINTPSTTAEGVVNFIATINDSGAVNASLTPSEFLQLYNMTRGSKNLCVAVNAKLAYDGVARSSSIATVDTTNRIVRIAFERDYGTAITNGVNQLNKTFDYIIGDAKTGTWVHETIDSKVFDFSRYEGFQFTRGAGNVITTDDESTPNAVYMQYHTATSGKLYQNLPTRLIDTVDGAEYWNGTFDVYGNHMTFTFVTSNYATSSDKMLVRVIELSADVNTTTWKYGVKEFTLPLSGAGEVVYVDFWGTGQTEVYVNDLKAYMVDLSSNQTYDVVFDLISSGANVIARLYTDSTKTELVAKSIETQLSGDKTLSIINFLFVHAATGVGLGFPTIADGIWMTKTSNGTSVYAVYKLCALPVPAGDNTDDGKVPTVNGTAWELKEPSSGDFVINGTLGSNGAVMLDKTFAQIRAAIQAGKQPVTKLPSGDITVTLPLAVAGEEVIVFAVTVSEPGETASYIVKLTPAGNASFGQAILPTFNSEGHMPQFSMTSAPLDPMQIATKEYVDDHVGGTSTKVALSGTIEGEVTGYTSATYQQIVDEIAKNGNIWLTIGGETVRLASWKQSGSSAYTLVFFGAGSAALTVKYEVTASASSATLAVTGS